MGAFDLFAGPVTRSLTRGSQQAILRATFGLLEDRRVGGVRGIIRCFEEAGLAETTSSWIGTGENLPLSGAMLLEALGAARIQSVAEYVGVSLETASSAVAEILPQLVDRLTPEGILPSAARLREGLKALHAAALIVAALGPTESDGRFSQSEDTKTLLAPDRSVFTLLT